MDGSRPIFKRTLPNDEKILIRIPESGLSVRSGRHVHGRFATWVAPTKNRSTMSDSKLLVDQVMKLGSELQQKSTHNKE
jgi:hypothetical protein